DHICEEAVYVEQPTHRRRGSAGWMRVSLALARDDPRTRDYRKVM
ncbi:10060_t:CDS:1, partial [Acaulospora colombiana]